MVASGEDGVSTRARIVELLKTQGPRPARELARDLGLTAMAIRQHLYQLERSGQAGHSLLRQGVGRPLKVWHLTPRADAHFPDAHRELSVHLIEAARSAFGDEGLKRLILERQKRLLPIYERRVGSVERSLGAKVEALAELRCAEGYMAEHSGAGREWTLVENHCPIAAAAGACGALCEAELALFRHVLGAGIQVQREEHILEGRRRCLYRVREEG